MKGFRKIGLVVVLAAIGCAPATSAEARKDRCARKGSRTLLTTRSLRLYSVVTVPASPTGSKGFACLRSTGARTWLDGAGSSHNAFVTAGDWIAFVERTLNPTGNPSTWTVYLVNARTRERHLSPFSNPFDSPRPHPSSLGGVVTPLALTAQGSVGYIDASFPPGAFYVHALDQDGDVILDGGPDLDPHSLRLSGSTLSWTNGGEQRTATLR